MFKRGAFLALTLIGGLFINTAVTSTAQAANEISRLVPFQGRLHGTDNKAVPDGVYDITFNVYDTPTGGTPAWTESHTQVSVIHGYVNVLLGAINPMHTVDYANVTPAYDVSKNHVDFSTKKYLGISINGGVEMFPRSQLVPSFHAFTANHAGHASQADNADNLGGKEAASYAQLTHVTSEDVKLNDRITAVSNGLNTDVTSASSRINTLEGYFNRVDPDNPKANDSEKLNGYSDSYFATQSDMDEVQSRFTDGVANDAEDANTLDNKDSTYFATATGLSAANVKISSLEGKFTGAKATSAISADGASNADKLDSISSTSFARTDVAETFAQPVTINNTLTVNSVSSPGAVSASTLTTSNSVLIGDDLTIGKDGKNDANINFYDDLHNQNRTIGWIQSEEAFMVEDVNSKMQPFIQVRSGSYNMMVDHNHNFTFEKFPNDILWAFAYLISNNTKSRINPIGFGNDNGSGAAYITFNRDDSFDGTTVMSWVAIGY